MNSLKYKIHDIVKVKDIGSIYPTYKDMADRLGATNWESGRLGKDIRGKTAEILNITKVTSMTTYHILIEMIEGPHFGEQYVIGQSGIKSIKIDILDDDMFEI